MWTLAALAQRHLHFVAFRREGARIVDQIAQDLSQRTLTAADAEASIHGRVIEHDFDTALMLKAFIGADDFADKARDIELLCWNPGDFGLQARGVGNIGDQAIEAFHILCDHPPQFFALFRVILDHFGRFNRRTNGGERIFQFMRDIGRKRLVRGDPFEQRIGHCFHRLRQVADFIMAFGDPRQVELAAAAAADAVGFAGQFAQRVGNPDGQQCRRHQCHQDGDRNERDERRPFGPDNGVDIVRFHCQHANDRRNVLDRQGH